MKRLSKFELAVNSATVEHDRRVQTDLKSAEDYAFSVCGCRVAWPAWWMREGGTVERVDCLHLECQIERGEFKRPAWLVRFTAAFRGELSNWLRFALETRQGRLAVARLYWAMKKKKEFNIMGCVFVGIGAH